jgi:hypothetical protein
MCHVLPREGAEDEAGALAIAEFCMFWGRNLRRSRVTVHYIGDDVEEPRSSAAADEPRDTAAPYPAHMGRS